MGTVVYLYRALLVVVIIIKESMAENCFPIPSSWKVSLISYEEATVSISWHEGSVFCTDRVIISQATDTEETISPPIKVSKGQAMIKLKDKCKLYTIRLAALLPGRNEVSCSPLSNSLLCTASWCTRQPSWSGSPPCSPRSLSCQIWPFSTSPWSVPLQR